MKKPSQKSSQRRGPGKPFVKGDPRIVGGAKPGAGRPPDEWKKALRQLADRDDVIEHISNALRAGPDHPFFAKALDYTTDHGYGRASQPLEHSGTIGLEALLAAVKPSE